MVAARVAFAVPPREQTRADALRVLRGPGPGLFGQDRGTLLRGEAEDLARGADEAAEVLVERSPERLPCVRRLDRRRDASLGPEEGGGEAERLGRGGGRGRESLRARGSPLEGGFGLPVRADGNPRPPPCDTSGGGGTGPSAW